MKSTENGKDRAAEIFDAQLNIIRKRSDRTFAALMTIQWLLGIVFALCVSPYTWSGTASEIHLHVYAAIFLGGAITGLPVYLALARPGEAFTRQTVAAGQMLMSALLIHLTGGRIETHFHVFGSLAFLATYRDWRVLATATVVVAVDHLLRGLYFPQSVYGVFYSQPWRFLEHAGWVVFEDIFLVVSLQQSLADMKQVAGRQADLEELNQTIEVKVRERTKELAESSEKLEKSRNALLQSEKMSAVGQLAAGIAHEINNPLGIILGFAQTLKSKTGSDDPASTPLHFIEKETVRCKELVRNLLIFSRSSRSDHVEDIDLCSAIDDALALVMTRGEIKNIRVVKELNRNLPKLIANKHQIQQIIMNLCNNAMDAMAGGGTLTIGVKQVQRNGSDWFVIAVRDTGTGIPEEIRSKIFEPFFTTKEVGKGTGLGLSLIHELVEKHHGAVEVESQVGKGTTFTVFLPLEATVMEKATQPNEKKPGDEI